MSEPDPFRFHSPQGELCACHWCGRHPLPSAASVVMYGFRPRSGRGRCALPMTFSEALRAGPPLAEDEALSLDGGSLL